MAKNLGDTQHQESIKNALAKQEIDGIQDQDLSMKTLLMEDFPDMSAELQDTIVEDFSDMSTDLQDSTTKDQDLSEKNLLMKDLMDTEAEIQDCIARCTFAGENEDPAVVIQEISQVFQLMKKIEFQLDFKADLLARASKMAPDREDLPFKQSIIAQQRDLIQELAECHLPGFYQLDDPNLFSTWQKNIQVAFQQLAKENNQSTHFIHSSHPWNFCST